MNPLESRSLFRTLLKPWTRHTVRRVIMGWTVRPARIKGKDLAFRDHFCCLPEKPRRIAAGLAPLIWAGAGRAVSIDPTSQRP
jgi:hypothetical protein